MIKRTKRMLTLRISQARRLEKESEKAARRFFGTFVEDIKRNWVDISKIKGKSNVNQQLISSV